MVELVFSTNQWTRIYTLNNFEDFIFRFEDLAPWAIVMDEKDFPPNNSLLREFILKKKINIIHVAEVDESLEFASLSLGKISRQLRPMLLDENLHSFYLKFVGSDRPH